MESWDAAKIGSMDGEAAQRRRQRPPQDTPIPSKPRADFISLAQLKVLQQRAAGQQKLSPSD